jgi:hypothetical protein
MTIIGKKAGSSGTRCQLQPCDQSKTTMMLILVQFNARLEMKVHILLQEWHILK